MWIKQTCMYIFLKCWNKSIFFTNIINLKEERTSKFLKRHALTETKQMQRYIFRFLNLKSLYLIISLIYKYSVYYIVNMVEGHSTAYWNLLLFYKNTLFWFINNHSTQNVKWTFFPAPEDCRSGNVQLEVCIITCDRNWYKRIEGKGERENQTETKGEKRKVGQREREEL